MRDYEVVYIFRSTFSPEEVEAKLEPFHALITDGGQGEVTAVVQWGKRQLAYPIDKQTTGHYVVAQFTAEPERLAELERVLKLQDDLLRYLVVLSEGELPLPETMHQSREVTGGEPAAPAADAPVADAPAAEGSAPAGEGDSAAAEEGTPTTGDEAQEVATAGSDDGTGEDSTGDDSTGDDGADKGGADERGAGADVAEAATDEKAADVDTAEGEA